jgi:hypothetical protein
MRSCVRKAVLLVFWPTILWADQPSAPHSPEAQIQSAVDVSTTADWDGDDTTAPVDPSRGLQISQKNYYDATTRKLVAAETWEGWAKENATALVGVGAAGIAFLTLLLNSIATTATFRLAIKNARNERRAI